MCKPKQEGHLTSALTDDQIMALLAACKGGGFIARRDTAIIRLFLATGAQLSEVSGRRWAPHNLTIHDVHPDRGIVRIMGKGRRERSTGAREPSRRWTGMSASVASVSSPGPRRTGSADTGRRRGRASARCFSPPRRSSLAGCGTRRRARPSGRNVQRDDMHCRGGVAGKRRGPSLAGRAFALSR